MMLPSIRHLVLTQLIAPHGITDLVHAQLNREYPRLVASYAGSLGAGVCLHALGQDPVLYGAFAAMSAVHFAHDFGPWWSACTELEREQLVQACIVTACSAPVDAFLWYMACLHVPTHYATSWHYLKRAKWGTVLSVAATAAWCDQNLVSFLTQYPYCAASIIIGHILYQEHVHSLPTDLHPPVEGFLEE